MPDVSVKMGVSGIAQFKQGMNEAQASVKTLDAALKANEKQFQRTGNAEEHYAAQTTLLNQKLKQQKEIIANAEKALKQMEQNGVSQNSTAYQKMQKTLIEATDAMMDTQDQLDSLGSKAEKTAEKTDKLSSSLGGLNKRVSLDQVISAVGSITSGLENAGRKAVQFGEQLWNTIMDSARRADDTATMADMYGIPLERYLQMQRLVGDGMETTVDSMLSAQDKLKRGMGNQTVLDELEKIGVSAKKAFGDEGVGDYQLKDSTELFWEAGQALMALGDEYDKEAIATTLFGKSWKELTSLFENYDSLEEYNKALDNTTVNDEETIRNLAELNDAVSALESSWTVLKDQVLGALAPALTKGAEAISGLLDSLTEYLKSDDGKELLESMGKAVEGLFKDISEIDPQEVVEGFTGIFNKVIEGFQWLEANSGTVIGALTAIVGGWGALKLFGGALEIYQLIQGITGLTGSTATAQAAGTAAGSSWGGAFATAVLKAAPWLIGLYTLLNPASSASNDLDVMVDPETGKLTKAGWADFYNNPDQWQSTFDEVGALFGDLASILTDENAINAMARYRESGDLDTLIAEMEALGYIRKLTEEERNPDLNLPDETKNVPTDKKTYRKNRRTGEMTEISDFEMPESGEKVGLSEEQAAAVERMWDALRSGEFTDEDVSAYEDAFKGQADLFKYIDEAMDHLYQTNNWDDEDLKGLPEDFFTVTAEPELADDAQQTLQATLDQVKLGAIVTITPSLTLGGIDFFSHANGLPMVPFDGYPALLHKGEQVIPAREVEASRNYSSNLYVERMIMNNGTDAEGLAAAMAAAQKRTAAGYGS